ERVHALSLAAGELFEKLEYRNVRVIVSDGTLGLPEQSPYDSIIVTAAAPEVPECYLEQLKDNGRLVIPVGSRYSQVLYQIRKTSSGLIRTASTPCVFVPLIGEKGWEDTDVY
ncbi:MAG: protein-L-isoaspartate O-methyltransferase, partial [Nitrospirota bacterium]|nr:protein-L-isoaspartate O-methyltransferase [Nitrospirota bacterium]